MPSGYEECALVNHIQALTNNQDVMIVVHSHKTAISKDVGMIALVVKRKLLFLTLTVIVTLGIVVSCAPDTQQELVDYAAVCAAEMGAIPAFSCLDDGVLIPITVGGIPQNSPVSSCDNPVQLGLGNEGQCVPFSRFVELSTGNSNVTTIAICRKYESSNGQNDPNFQDIAMIQHNRQTGNTCWYQSPPGRDRDGSNVPSPMEGSSFWLPPAETGRINCQQCHDADPFIWTPYVAQVAHVNTWNPNGTYISNFQNIFPHPQPASFRPPGNDCTVCHRFGESTCRPSRPDLPLSRQGLDLILRAETGRWMPPNHTDSEEVWHEKYDADIDQLERCCANPSLAECATTTTSPAPQWGEFADNGCIAIGVRKYSAVLHDVPGGADWEDTCNTMPAIVAGQSFSNPSRCVNTGLNIWGEFDVSDSGCVPRWGEFADNGCTAIGVRKYSAVLHDIPGGVSWEDTCNAMPATVAGQSFSNPSRCVNTGLNIWGEFDISDSSCAPTWGEFSRGSCLAIGIRQYSAILHDIPGGVSWEAACQAMPATIEGQSFSSPSRCVNNGLNIWGEFDIADGSCAARWGDFKDDGCQAPGVRQFSAILWDIPAGVDWEDTCRDTSATVVDQFFSSPSRCLNTGFNIWGEFDVSDSSCP